MIQRQFSIVFVFLCAAWLVCGCEESDGEKLKAASVAGDTNLVTTLIEKGADVNWGDQYTGTALHKAALRGDIGMVEFLISKGADVNGKIEPGLLTVASKTRDEDNGILSEIENAHGATPLHIAVDNNHFEIVRILVENGASVHRTLTLGYDYSKRKNIRTSLDIARSRGYSDIADYLEMHVKK